MAQLPSIVTDIIMLIFKYHILHVVILSDILFISARFPFFMVLQFYVTDDSVFFQIKQIPFSAVAAVSGSLFRKCSECRFVFLEHRDQGIIV